jgi:hypothetical protein
MEIFAIISTVIAVLGVIGSIFFFSTAVKLYKRLKEAEELVDVKNDALKDAFDALHEHNDKLWDLRDELVKLKSKTTSKKPGRPVGSRNKVGSKKPGRKPSKK